MLQQNQQTVANFPLPRLERLQDTSQRLWVPHFFDPSAKSPHSNGKQGQQMWKLILAHQVCGLRSHSSMFCFIEKLDGFTLGHNTTGFDIQIESTTLTIFLLARLL